MQYRILGATLVAAGLMACASQAAANGFTLTYQGVVSTGSDDTNIFGLGAGASLAGQAITESFVVDYAGGGNHNIGSGYFRTNIGGAGFVTSAVTINGITKSVGTETGLDDRTDEHLNPSCAGNPNCFSSFSVASQDEDFLTTGNLVEEWRSFGDDLGRALDYHPSLALGPPVFTAADNLDFEGSFFIDHSLHNFVDGTVTFSYDTSASFTPDSVTITTFNGGVPEPAAWALMMVGFGAAGAALRRRRSAMALA